MAKNESITITYTAWDTGSNEPKTGDVANHTLKVIADGVSSSPADSPAEVLYGEYKIVIAADENTGTMMAVVGESSTANIEIIKVSWQNIVINILPISSVASDDGSQNATSLVGYQYSDLGPLVITVTDVDGNAVNLLDDSLKFIVWEESDPTTIIFTIPGNGGSITVSGAGNNIATIAAPSTLMTTAYRSLRWKLFDTTEKIQRAWGYLTIQIMGDEPA